MALTSPSVIQKDTQIWFQWRCNHQITSTVFGWSNKQTNWPCRNEIMHECLVEQENLMCFNGIKYIGNEMRAYIEQVNKLLVTVR